MNGALQSRENANHPGGLATCDRCRKRITETRHKCQQCPDFDYCSSCLVKASQTHPHHEFVAMNGTEVLSQAEQLQWRSTRDLSNDSDTTFRLIGQDMRVPLAICRSCEPLTKPLPSLGILLQDPKLKSMALEGRFAYRWKVRISSLVEACQRGCALCTFMLDKFFGISNGQTFALVPIQPWYMRHGPLKTRSDLVMHAMKLLARLKSDVFLFNVQPMNTRKGYSLPDFDKLKIELVKSDLDATELQHVLPSRGHPYVTFDVYAASGNPAAALIKARPPNANPGSTEALSTACQWLHDCEQNHPACQRAINPDVTDLPKRLIDVSFDDGRLKLCRLETYESHRYAALSYCWGGQQSFCLDKNTHQTKLAGFSLSDLPPTLQDAVKVTRSIGLKYLWVDSLCIIQDDEDDRSNELKIMGNIYRNSYVTISATMAWGVADGFLSDLSDPETKLRKNLTPMGYPMPNSKATTVDEVFQLPNEVFGTIWLIEEEPEAAYDGREPTSLRGWCLQERLLSTRFLEYGYWPTWRCNAAVHSDGGWYTGDSQASLNLRNFTRNLLKPQSELSNPSMDLFGVDQLLGKWRAFVSDFSKRKLSVDTDKLPAVAGIAAEIQRRTGLAYCAGLWRNDLLYDMMWFARAREWLVRYKEPLAPTWSWVSVHCPVTYDAVTKDAIPLARVLDCQVSQEHGAPPVGHITLDGPVRQVDIQDVLKLFSSQNMGPSPPKSNDVREWYNQILENIALSPENKMSDEEVKEKMPKRVFAILTYSRAWYMRFEKQVNEQCYSGILLSERDTGDGYERIGAFVNEAEPWMHSSGGRWKHETIDIY